LFALQSGHPRPWNFSRFIFFFFSFQGLYLLMETRRRTWVLRADAADELARWYKVLTEVLPEAEAMPFMQAPAAAANGNAQQRTESQAEP
jgi:hypothetical protein